MDGMMSCEQPYGIPIFFTEKEIPGVFKQLRIEDSKIQKLLMASFMDGGKEIRCPMTVERK